MWASARSVGMKPESFFIAPHRQSAQFPADSPPGFACNTPRIKTAVTPVAQERTLALYFDQPLDSQFVQMMRKCRAWNSQLCLNFVYYQPIRMSLEQQLHYPKSRLRPHRGKHVRVLESLIYTGVHISMIAEI